MRSVVAVAAVLVIAACSHEQERERERERDRLAHAAQVAVDRDKMLDFGKAWLTDARVAAFCDVLRDGNDNPYDHALWPSGTAHERPANQLEANKLGDRLDAFATAHGFAGHNDFEGTRLRVLRARGVRERRLLLVETVLYEVEARDLQPDAADLALVARHRGELDEALATFERRVDRR